MATGLSSYSATAGLTICNGYVGYYPLGGGGILNWGGDLTVNNCTLSNNQANYGGGIGNEAGGTLTVSGCTLSGNHFIGTTGSNRGRRHLQRLPRPRDREWQYDFRQQRAPIH